MAFALAVFMISEVRLNAEENTAAPYRDDEFPLFMQDLRRFEIVTLGAMPFVTLDTMLGFSAAKWVGSGFSSSSFPNPFSPSSENGFTQEEQVGIVLTSLGICVGIGLTDLIVRLVRRGRAGGTSPDTGKDIVAVPVSESPDAERIPNPRAE